MSRHLDRALFLSERGRHQDAVRELLAHLQEDPENGYVHAMLALEFSNCEQCEQARTHAQKAIGLLPEHGLPYYTMAHVCYLSDQMPQAAEWIAEAIERDPDDPKYFYVLAAIRANQGLYRESLAAIDDCLALDAEHHDCLVLKSSIQLAQGKSKAAAQTSRAALRLNPEISDAHIIQSFWAIRQGQHRQAFETIREGLRLDPNSTSGRLALRYALVFTNPLLVILLGIHFLLAAAAPLVLALSSLLVIRMEAEVLPEAAANDLGQVVGTLIVYGLALCVVLAKPLADFYIQLFPDGRRLIDRSELQVGGCLLALGLAYWAALGLSLSLGAPSFSIVGFFLFLPAMVVASPLGEIYSWNIQRQRMLLVVAVALVAILLPLSLNWFPIKLSNLGQVVATYESLVAVACMGAFYFLRCRPRS